MAVRRSVNDSNGKLSIWEMWNESKSLSSFLKKELVRGRFRNFPKVCSQIGYLLDY